VADREPPAGGAVLVVDDEPLNRDLLRRMLAPEFAVIEAADADGAISQLENGAGVRVVVCDQLMPGRVGTELAAEVRARWPAVRFFLLTGYEDDAEVRRALASGLVERVISKPWSAPLLKQLLRAALTAAR
jgi:CheY-like chemotaxis protein